MAKFKRFDSRNKKSRKDKFLSQKERKPKLVKKDYEKYFDDPEQFYTKYQN